MKVICAGLPKTGTKSLCAALRILGFTVYDFEEQCWLIRDKLQKAMDVGCTAEEYHDMFQGVDAVTDLPACLLWEEISKAFPKAKDEKEWLKSFLHQMSVIRDNIVLRILLKFTRTGSKVTHFGDTAGRVGFGFPHSKVFKFLPINEKVLLMRYKQHNAYVMQTAPKDRFLAYNVKDGWESLCKFLDLPVPSEEFPHKNKSGVFIDELMEDSLMFRRIRQEIVVTLCVVIVLTSIFIAAFLV
ncbi:uncharacterized protein LOC143448306 [Clavelina lepadiformis]|uniref:uncharacterized protein LOC143448306 n=1 Tax=Clavelina lepadiformis TaxID=159417 RepID=UPI004041F473